MLFTSPPYGNPPDATTAGIDDWGAPMRRVCGDLHAAIAADGQMVVNLGLLHRDSE